MDWKIKQPCRSAVQVNWKHFTMKNAWDYGQCYFQLLVNFHVQRVSRVLAASWKAYKKAACSPHTVLTPYQVAQTMFLSKNCSCCFSFCTFKCSMLWSRRAKNKHCFGIRVCLDLKCRYFLSLTPANVRLNVSSLFSNVAPMNTKWNSPAFILVHSVFLRPYFMKSTLNLTISLSQSL